MTADRIPKQEPAEKHVVALLKDNKEKYLFIFDDAGKAETLRTFGRFASNTELSFSWYDAAFLSRKVKEICSHG
jgi:hypothetical protein